MNISIRFFVEAKRTKGTDWKNSPEQTSLLYNVKIQFDFFFLNPFFSLLSSNYICCTFTTFNSFFFNFFFLITDFFGQVFDRCTLDPSYLYTYSCCRWGWGHWQWGCCRWDSSSFLKRHIHANITALFLGKEHFTMSTNETLNIYY